jgi:NADH:ubiquinone oxidoreductase subunit 4 (subunit M)
MTSIYFLLMAVFLPVFPFSMLFNRMFARLGNAWLRMALLLLWPQLGVLTLVTLGQTPDAWMVWWAVATSGLYALRAVALRDLRLWTGYMATSAWSLLWPAAAFAPVTASADTLVLQAVGLSMPLVLLTWLSGTLDAKLGAAYAGVCGGLAGSVPRLSGLLTLAVLAVVATPLVPSFFVLLATTLHTLPVMPSAAVLILIVWLLWAWGGVRILRGFIVGPACGAPIRDLGTTAAGLFALIFVALLLAGIGISGRLS